MRQIFGCAAARRAAVTAALGLALAAPAALATPALAAEGADADATATAVAATTATDAAPLADTSRLVPKNYTGWLDEAGERYWFDNGVMARSKEAYDPESNAWYWFDADGTMARSKDVFIPSNGGKWVRYDASGHMAKGEVTARSKDDGKIHTWYFDPITGAMQKGFSYVSEQGIWCYFDLNMGWKLYGEHYLKGDKGTYNWYLLNEESGAVTYGWKDLGSKTVYYDEVTGIMAHGYKQIGGVGYYFDEVTGAKTDKVDASAAVWSKDKAYVAKMVAKIEAWGSDTEWAVVVDKSFSALNDRVGVFELRDGEWQLAMSTNAYTSGNTFTCETRKFKVDHRARWYWQDGYDINDWWVCYYPNWISDGSAGSGHSLVFNDAMGRYDEGQGFHYGYSSAGCVAMPDKKAAEYIYQNVVDGSAVLIFDSL